MRDFARGFLLSVAFGLCVMWLRNYYDIPHYLAYPLAAVLGMIFGSVSGRTNRRRAWH